MPSPISVPDLHVVEAHVVLPAAAEGEPVVVDDGHPVGLGVGLDGGPHAGVEGIDHQDAGPGRDGGLGVGELGGVAALGVLDAELGGAEPGRGEGLGQVGGVELGVAGRGDGVGQDDGDFALALGGQAFRSDMAVKSLVNDVTDTVGVELPDDAVVVVDEELLLLQAAARRPPISIMATRPRLRLSLTIGSPNFCCSSGSHTSGRSLAFGTLQHNEHHVNSISND